MEVPPNTTATVRLPQAKLETVTEGGKPVQGLDGVTASRQDGETTVVDVGSGPVPVRLEISGARGSSGASGASGAQGAAGACAAPRAP